jgi:iron complex transport system permease protein
VSAVAATVQTRAERRGWWLPILLAAVLAIALAELCLGVVPVPVADVPRQIVGAITGDRSGLDPIAHAVVMTIRLPRLLIGLAVGAALGLAGAAMQGLFRNPLAEPGLVGVSAGAALGAATVAVLGGAALRPFGAYALPVAAFAFGLAATATVQAVARLGGGGTGTLLLAGIAVNSLAVSAIGLLQYFSDDNALRALTFWSLGSLGQASWKMVLPTVIAIVVGAVVLARQACALDVLLLGEREAGHLGIAVAALRRRLVLLTALLVGAAVAVAGMVGFVGLVVPHLCRLMLGPGHTRLLPAAALAGAGLLVLADLVARLLAPPAELPLGVITGLIGAPFFVWLLACSRSTA